jgi:hypothetical protein
VEAAWRAKFERMGKTQLGDALRNGGWLHRRTEEDPRLSLSKTMTIASQSRIS